MPANLSMKFVEHSVGALRQARPENITRVDIQVGPAKRCGHRIANSLDNHLHGCPANALDLLMSAVCGVFPKKPITAHCGNDLQRIQRDSPTLGEQLEYEPLDHRERELAKVAVMGQKDCGHFFPGRATPLTEAMNDLEGRPAVLKLLHLGEKQIDRLDKCRRIFHPDISRPAFLGLEHEFRIAMLGRKAKQTRSDIADAYRGIEIGQCCEYFMAPIRNVKNHKIRARKEFAKGWGERAWNWR